MKSLYSIIKFPRNLANPSLVPILTLGFLVLYKPSIMYIAQVYFDDYSTSCWEAEAKVEVAANSLKVEQVVGVSYPSK